MGLDLMEEIERFIKTSEQSPLIQDMMEQIFSIAPSSTSCERTFSTAGIIISKIRNRMGSDLADAIIFLKNNLD